MVLTTVLLLAVLFIAGLVNIFFLFPTPKLLAWFQSLSIPYSTPTTTPSKDKNNLVMNSINPQPKVEDRAAELKQVFATFDKNSDGFITTEELKESLKNIRIFMSDTEVEEMVKKVDANGDGLIDFDEFCMLCRTMRRREDGGGAEEEEEEELKEAFGVFDKDKDGLISVEELAVVLCSLGLREGNKVEDCKEMVRKVDRDGDGMVNFDEFKRMMKGGGLRVAH
ncbi:calmodulin-like protein 7 [Pyrus ussuriensis x Pyrus communis]|uniref:Calmodulin-like protein 7 n=1 Tax=Pyrus ussuriensis x Pyrus communis TaxID=2448454 RepID=A0A5N5GXX4_9ROSA|nr:calmodulin-like protein 7 [Pyrus x bretschneideri]KAB2618592.1 calmodulin-like protein 7 [Pyrus ussuriensis x Pyrus communis]